MLNPRRANSPAIRVRTPGLFSTRIDSTCLRPVRRPATASSWSSERTSLVPGSPMTATPLTDHVASGLPRRNHRVRVLLAGHAHVDEHGALGGDRLADVVDQGVLVLQADARGAVCAGELDEVRVLAHVDLAVALVPE